MLLITRAAAAIVLALALLAPAADAHKLRSFRGQTSHVLYGPESPAEVQAPVEECYFEHAILDHFAPLSERKYWKQRYFVNEEFWAGRDYPVFVSIGGEGPVGPRALTNRTFINAMAKKHRALLVAVEHRYYGKSYPTEDMSLPNLRYLSSEQALADLARMHAFLSGKYGLSESSKWIGFGGSYPGNLAAWLKLKYPALFAGTIASSAPVLAKTNFFEYMEVVGDGLRYFGGGECYHAVEKAIVELRKLLDGGAEGRKKIDELFFPCYPMANEYDDSVFESSVMSAFQGIAQYNALSPGTLTLSDVCAHFTNSTSSSSSLELLSSFLNTTLETGATCLDSKFEGEKNATVDVLRESKFDGASSSRQWFYQTCNEFGYFQTSTSARSPFHALKSVTEHNVGAEICKRVFNINEAPDVEGANIDYGALQITVENVTFPSGTIDPWHALAVQNSTALHSRTATSVFIEGTAHCADMYYPSEKDAPALQWAHAKISASIDRYLGKASPVAASNGADVAIE
ncbi:hypothetical protein PybrP1_001952 [[Pythium] brassicae (nom. inval.)]|nr:hypothetical protein PybrP1_001952 [[Pythium] brassicae (nom. inval.)]